ncbi:hypothetical protein HDU76_000618, partial [Blyttiomyces sp. JEL0837]
TFENDTERAVKAKNAAYFKTARDSVESNPIYNASRNTIHDVIEEAYTRYYSGGLSSGDAFYKHANRLGESGLTALRIGKNNTADETSYIRMFLFSTMMNVWRTLNTKHTSFTMFNNSTDKEKREVCKAKHEEKKPYSRDSKANKAEKDEKKKNDKNKSGENDFKCRYHANMKKQNHNTKECHELDALKGSAIEFECNEFMRIIRGGALLSYGSYGRSSGKLPRIAHQIGNLYYLDITRGPNEVMLQELRLTSSDALTLPTSPRVKIKWNPSSGDVLEKLHISVSTDAKYRLDRMDGSTYTLSIVKTSYTYRLRLGTDKSTICLSWTTRSR